MSMLAIFWIFMAGYLILRALFFPGAAKTDGVNQYLAQIVGCFVKVMLVFFGFILLIYLLNLLSGGTP